ncbi:MAG: Gfo/Idh/MocA family oxidoreductase [Opitutaceae bacterium]|jgi:predicted dehydrogenase|nr:Gfo/Idh/MocA family oxidoreductase [Opitutaceae bacterium]
MKYFRILIFVGLLSALNLGGSEPIRIGIVGMVHGHVNGFLRRAYAPALEIAGIVENDPVVVQKYQERYDLDPGLFTEDLEGFLDAEKPVAVWVFSTTFDHLAIVEACAPRGVHVVVEKPLAVSLADAKRMAALGEKHGTHVLTNLETTWYPSLHETYRLAVDEEQLGPITKIVSHFGHMGPAAIRVPEEFFDWLTDPVLNGGGASADFGCYGGNLITWMLGNERPISVTAVFQTNQPEVYPNVDDNATIVLEYPEAQGIIQASWDWTFPRKDMHVYGRAGIIRTIDQDDYDIRMERRGEPVAKKAEPLPETISSAVNYFSAVFRGELDPTGSLSSIENNLIAMEIQEAAKESARSGKRVLLN